MKQGTQYVLLIYFFKELVKSVAFSLTLRADDMTLTDEHAEATVASILSQI